MLGYAGAPRKRRPSNPSFPHARASDTTFLFDAAEVAPCTPPRSIEESLDVDAAPRSVVPHFDYDRTRCEALVWVAQGIAMRQCHHPKKHGDRCGIHRTKAPHGTVFQPLSTKVEESKRLPKQAIQRRQGFKWYSRVTLWQVAKNDFKKQVEQLTDQEFEACLERVNAYFRMHPAYHVSWKLKAFQLSLIHI